jgi:hypothetical protein
MTQSNLYYKLRYGNINELYNLLNLTYVNYLSKPIIEYHKYNIDQFSDFNIIKRPQNLSIICISPSSQIIDIKLLHPSQILLMRINYKSFINEFDFDQTNTDDNYIENLTKHLVDIMEQIKTYMEQNIVNQSIIPIMPDLKYLETEIYPRSSFLTNNEYCVANLKDYILQTDNAIGKINKIKCALNTFNFLYTNFQFVVEHNNFSKVVYKKIKELELELDYDIIKQNMKELNINQQKYNINSYLRLKSTLLRVENMFMIKLSDVIS